jgi:hypothetical protein
MDEPENCHPRPRPTIKTIELDDQTKRAAMLEVVRRLEWVREQTNARARREPRTAPTTKKG